MSMTFRLYLKLLALVLVLAVLAPFTFLKDENGRPWMSLSRLWNGEHSLASVRQQLGWLVERVSAGGEQVARLAERPDSGGEEEEIVVIDQSQLDTLYTWQDELGVRHYSLLPNPHGPSQAMYMAPNRTLADYQAETRADLAAIAAYRQAQAGTAPEKAESPAENPTPQAPAPAGPFTTNPLEALKQARELEKQLGERRLPENP